MGIYLSQRAPQAAPCIDDAEFNDVDLLATLTAFSRWRGKRRSQVVGPTLQCRIADALSMRVGGDGACKSRPVRAPTKTPVAHKNGNWNDENLRNAMNAVTDDGMPLRQANRLFGVPTTSLRDHLYGKTRGMHKGIKPTLKSHEEKKLVNYVFKMQKLGHPLTPI